MANIDLHNPQSHSIVLSKLNLDIIEGLKNSYNHNRFSENTRASYYSTGKDFNAFLAETRQEVNAKSIRDFLDSLNLSPATLDQKLAAIKKIIKEQPGYKYNNLLQLLVNEELSSVRTKHKSERAVHRDEYLDIVQVETLKEKIDIKLALIIEAMYQTGCRVSELNSIRHRDLKLLGQNVKVRIVAGKGNKERTVYIKRELYDQIIDVYGQADYLFVTDKGKKFHRSTLFVKIRQAGLLIGVHIGNHTFRHSCAMRLKELGASIKYISEYLGHSSTAVTADFYFHDKPGAEVTNYF